MLTVDERLIEAIVEIAYTAADSILAVYESKTIDVEEKSDYSPLTAADLASHKAIVQALAALDPAIPILSEESDAVDYAVRKTWTQYWLVDPLDGTKEFIARNPEFTVNIALIDQGVPVLGVVQVPPTGMCYVGSAQFGARRRASRGADWERVQSRTFNPDKAFAVVASRHHGQSALSGLFERFEAQFGQFSVENIGSALKICLCADGQADLYPRLAPTCEWDTAAAQAVLEAAGGVLVDDQGKPLRYNTKESLKNPYFFAIGDRTYDWMPILLGAAE